MLSFPYPFFLVEIILPLPVGTQMAKTMLPSPLNLSIGIKLSNERFSAPRKSRTFSCYVHARLPLLFSDCWHCLIIEEVDNVHKLKSAIPRPQGFSLKKKNGREMGKSPWGRDWADAMGIIKNDSVIRPTTFISAYNLSHWYDFLNCNVDYSLWFNRIISFYK